MKFILKVFLVLCPLLFFSTCLDNIDIEVPESTPLLTVDGIIYNAPPPYYVKLSESAIFVSGPEGIPDAVTGAKITLKDDLGNEEVLTEIEDGKYATSAGGIHGTIGRTYWISIQIGQEVYESKPEEMLPVVSAESLEFELSTEERFNLANNLEEVNLINVLVNTGFSNELEQTFLKWNTFGIYQLPEVGLLENGFSPKICYVTDNIDFDNVVVVDSKDVLSGFLQKEQVISEEINFRFAFRYCFKIIQQSINKDTYDFWLGVSQELERSGNIFEVPPGKIRGNIVSVNGEEVLGLFSAIATDTISLLVSSQDVGRPLQLCNSFGAIPNRCVDCERGINSTLIRPSCFD